MKTMKRYACLIMYALAICTTSCMRKDIEAPTLPQPSRTIMTETDQGSAMVVDGDTILTWTGADDENRITALTNGKEAGLSIIFGYPARIFVYNIKVYKNGKLEKVVYIENMHPISEESTDTLIVYDKHGKPETDSLSQMRYDYFHETWENFN